MMKLALTILTIFFLSTVSRSQTWTELSLPRQPYFVLGTGNPTVSGALAIWMQGRSIVDTNLSRFIFPAHFYTSSNGGSNWQIIDSSTFTIIDAPPLYYSDSPHDLVYVGNSIARITSVTEGIDLFGYTFEYKKGSAPFVRRNYGHVFGREIGTPWLYLSNIGDVYNPLLRYDDPRDSISFSLLKSTNEGANWNYLPDSVRGIHRLWTPTSLTFRPRSPITMFLGSMRGIYRSASEGESWTYIPTNSALDTLIVRFVHLHPKDATLLYAAAYDATGSDNRDILFRSTNGGIGWQEIYRETLIRRITTCENDARIALMSTSSGMVLTTDRGSTWKSAHNNLPSPLGVYHDIWLHLDAVNSSRAYVGYANKIFVTDNLLSIDRQPPTVDHFGLDDVFPNPISKAHGESLSLRFHLPSFTTNAVIRITDMLGRVVHTSSEKDLEAGAYQRWISNEVFVLRSGSVYFLTLTGDGHSSTKKIIVRD